MMGLGLLMGTTSCEDFLYTDSPSQADVNFVFASAETAQAALQNAYSEWRASGNVHSNGAFYDMVVGSSDTEAQPESYGSQINRWVTSYFYGDIDNTKNLRGPENFPNVSNNGTLSGTWNNLYKIIAILNTTINSFEAADSFEAMINQTAPTALSQTYGEAIALRATIYFELMRFFGDVPLQLVAGETATELTNRSKIAEFCLDQLMKVEPLMYRPGEGSRDKTYMSRTYVDGLIGRIAMWEAGYQTRRTDFGDSYYTKLDGSPIQFEKMYTSDKYKCFYGRRTDWKEVYQKALPFLAAAYENPGSAVAFQESDPRPDSKKGQKFGNPFQYVFQQMNNLEFATENVYEIPETQGAQGERPYAFGRPSDGGNGYFYPSKTYCQARFQPIYYWDDFDPDDMRRDVTVTVFGSRGNGQERLIPFTKGSTAKAGGPALNKWDENRMEHPWVKAQRQAGINCPYMRFAEIMLMYAEVLCDLGQTGQAQAILERVHRRALGDKCDINAFIAKSGDLRHAIYNERKLEFGGEGVRKWDVIRSGYVDEIVTSFRTRTNAMIADLQKNGYHTFDNGNEISAYVWIKDVDVSSQQLVVGKDGNGKDILEDNPFYLGYRLTTTCTDRENPVQWPAWRGQNDDWFAVGSEQGDTKYFANLKFGLDANQYANVVAMCEADGKTTSLTSDLHTNVAIKGLFKYIDPESQEAKDLEADGYVKTAYGAELIKDQKNIDDYSTYVYNGYESKTPPIYMFPMHGDVIKQNPEVLIQGYGFQSK